MAVRYRLQWSKHLLKAYEKETSTPPTLSGVCMAPFYHRAQTAFVDSAGYKWAYYDGFWQRMTYKYNKSSIKQLLPKTVLCRYTVCFRIFFLDEIWRLGLWHRYPWQRRDCLMRDVPCKYVRRYYTSFIHHKVRWNNETNKQAWKEKRNLTKLN